MPRNQRQSHGVLNLQLQGLYSKYINVYLPIYPGVPLVSFELFGDQVLAMPKSVSLTYPDTSNKIFSGFKSLCIIAIECRYSSANTKQAAMNSMPFIYMVNYLFAFR